MIPRRIYDDEMARKHTEKNTIRKIFDFVISIIRASKGKKFSIEVKEKWEPLIIDEIYECNNLMIFNTKIILIELGDDDERGEEV